MISKKWKPTIEGSSRVLSIFLISSAIKRIKSFIDNVQDVIDMNILNDFLSIEGVNTGIWLEVPATRVNLGDVESDVNQSVGYQLHISNFHM